MQETNTIDPFAKGFIKNRDMQARIATVIVNDPSLDNLAVAERLYDWFIDAPREMHLEALAYLVGHMRGTVSSKMEWDYKKPGRSSAKPHNNSPERQMVKAKARAAILKWMEQVLHLTFAQLRAAKIIPDDLLANHPDEAKFGDVYSTEEQRDMVAKRIGFLS